MRKTKPFKILPLLSAILLVAVASNADVSEFDLFEKPVAIKSYTSLNSVPQGGSIDIAVVLKMKTPWHVNA
ncbi:MAG: hypothetical protein JSW50_01315, partial [Candidatus Latescibacterota bacterium]